MPLKKLICCTPAALKPVGRLICDLKETINFVFVDLTIDGTVHKCRVCDNLFVIDNTAKVK